MTLKEQLDDFLKTVCSYNIVSLIEADRMNNEFDFETFEKVVYLEQNADKLSENDWKDFYLANKENAALVLEIVKLGKAPVDIITEILYSCPFKTLQDNSHLSHVEELILLESFKYNIPAETIEDLFGDGEDFPYLALYNAYKDDDKIKEAFSSFNIEPIKALCEKYIECYNEDELEYPEQAFLFYGIFRYIPDKDYIEELITREEQNGFLPEIIKTVLLNNVFLNPSDPKDEELMNRLFECGCVHSLISNFTPYMAKSCADIAFDAVINSKSNDIVLPNSTSMKEERDVLLNLIHQKLLPESYEYDLGERFLESNYLYHSDIIVDLFTNTSNKNLINKVMLLNSKIKPKVLDKNPNINYETGRDIVLKFIDDFQHGKARDVNVEYFNHVVSWMAHKYKLRDKDYAYILNKLTSAKSCLELASCPTAPMDTLGVLIQRINPLIKNSHSVEKSKHYETAKLVAKLNLFCKRYQVYEDLMLAILEISKAVGSEKSLSKYQSEYSVLSPSLYSYSSQKTHAIPSTLNPYVPVTKLLNLIDKYTENEINDMCKILEKYKNNETDKNPSKSEIAFIEYFLSLKEQALKDKYFVKYPDAKSVKEISNENLEEILKSGIRVFKLPLLRNVEKKEFITTPANLDAYIELYKIVTAHTIAKQEFLLRGLSLPELDEVISDNKHDEYDKEEQVY